MSDLVDFRNGSIFPSFWQLPSSYSFNDKFFFTDNEDRYYPIRHWALLAEIAHVELLDLYIRMKARDVEGTVFPVSFNTGRRGFELPPDLMHAGNAIIILHALRIPSMDYGVGIHVSDIDTVKVSFPVNLFCSVLFPVA